MTASYNPAEVERLIARARKRYASFGAVATADALDMADQLEAARAEIERMRRVESLAFDAARDQRNAEIASIAAHRYKLEAMARLATDQRDAAQAELARLRTELDTANAVRARIAARLGLPSTATPEQIAERVEAAIRVVEASKEWRSARCDRGDGRTYHDHDCPLNEHMRGLVDEVDAYR